MGFRSTVATGALNYARSVGEKMGLRLAVEVDGGELKTSMEVPDTDVRAWDSDLFRKAGLFIKGYANPVKPVVTRNPEPKEPDDLEADGAPADDSKVFDVVPSYRYREHQDQSVLSELVNPTEQWKTIVYLVLGMIGLQFLTVIVTLYATGSF
jgi:hypothetical protein